MNATLIFNPTSRGIQNDLRKVNRVYHRLFKRGIDAEPAATAGPGHAAELARRAMDQNKQLIIAYGGDGTINEIIAGMAPTSVPLAIIPGGAANVLARELGIHLNLKASIQTVAEGEPLQINLGRGNARIFHTMAGIGIDAHIVRAVDPSLKAALGRGAFVIEGVKHLSYRWPVFRIFVDGRDYLSNFAVISNARYYGGPFLMAPHAKISEETFDVCIFDVQSNLRYVLYFLSSYFGTHLKFKGIHYVKATAVFAECEEPALVQMDGELVGQLPMRFNILPKALSVIVPPPRHLK